LPLAEPQNSQSGTIKKLISKRTFGKKTAQSPKGWAVFFMLELLLQARLLFFPEKFFPGCAGKADEAGAHKQHVGRFGD
jgi:hypothetical protein